MPISLPDDPARADVLAARPTLWLNPAYRSGPIPSGLPVSAADVADATAAWARLAPVLARCFPELQATGGAIRSELIEALALRDALGLAAHDGRIFVKADNALPVAGSIKARGGVFEVFLHAETLARAHGLPTDALDSPDARALFGRHTVAVGSTGNLGLSVGIAARALGFRAAVHMSFDAKAWKVDRLRKLGVEVHLHQADYTSAVEAARLAAEADPMVYFVDDERSRTLFLGYSAAAAELAAQLAAAGVTVDGDHPLFVHLPCGIGGAPGGVAFGLKAIFGAAVHCFFVEPVQSPCALVHLMSGSDELVSVYDVGLTNRTEADGMAVARMSAFVAEVMRPLLSGVFTVADDDLFRWLHMAWDTQGIMLEPSAAASFAGPSMLASARGQDYRAAQRLSGKAATHVLWATGGSFVPQEQFDAFVAKGAALRG